MSGTNIIPPVLTDNDIQRFWTYVDKTPGLGPKGECWHWKAGRTDRGYGRFFIQQGNIERTIRAHRVSHFLTSGEWTPLGVLHSCDNPPCCNPDHLSKGTAADNAQDAIRRNRILRGESSPSARLTEEIIRAMRALKGTKPMKHIGQDFGVSESHSNRILKNQVWKHILP